MRSRDDENKVKSSQGAEKGGDGAILDFDQNQSFFIRKS